MESFRGISQKNFLDFEWFFYDSFEPQNAAFPEQLLMVGSVWLNKGKFEISESRCSTFFVVYEKPLINWLCQHLTFLNIFFNRFRNQLIDWESLGLPRITYIVNLKVTLMQIWKSANIFVFIWKQYVEISH